MVANGDVGGKVSATIIAGRGAGYAELHLGSDQPAQSAFVYFAGPWAGARTLWPAQSLASLGDISDSKPFYRALDESFTRSGAGEHSDQYEYEKHTAAAGVEGSEPRWSAELERVWPVIGKLATELRSRLEDGSPELIDFGGPVQCWVRQAEMPRAEVVELVQPLLKELGCWRCVS